ncbi:Alcohol dehydrogenase GroES domain protein [Emticicia oligotrophica DSM 17448]|uniref:Alcohol dehydrogenase GroES domain protein n=1 Tax=Emticicia oligotrophica (strain DSM 17448 / CIP 109782 / MTCC 6937 / GPTSA100-15) TaxID=929562 RepID=A0ABN4AKD2_EMTOG|nr:alcohol dehydrogenase catalytic domain-containing protein [Emticicia oligotrophica]AFK02734.1 Alcohol dehydrogenase GroES domain protein [Emticicia oligotrophica DSM 17448]
MKAAFLEEPQKIVFKEIAIPEPKRGEVRVKLSKVGICGSDVHLFLGHRLLNKPTVIGHEGLGIIDKLGEGVNNRKVGEKVVIEPNIACNHCKHCLNGKGYICSNKRVIGLLENGCFAEYVCVPADYCWVVPAEMDELDAVCIEPMAVGVHALFTSSAKPGDTIAIIGLGAIGLLLNHLALRLGYNVFVSEINQQKLQMAVEEGAIAANGDADTLNKLWEENDVSAVFECAGSAATASLVAAAAPRGSEIVLVGLSEKQANFTPLKIAREGISILPSIIYHHPTDFRRAIQLIRNKTIQPHRIISSFSPFHDLQNALEKAAIGAESKIIIEI